MTTVQTQMLRLVQAIDPRDEDQNVYDLTTIGVNDGERFTKERQLDIYNGARLTLQAVLNGLSNRGFEVSENVQENLFAFASGLADKPAGYMRHVVLMSPEDLLIPIIPVGDFDKVASLGSLKNPFVIEQATKFEDPSGGLYVQDSSEYLFRYVAVPSFVLADITGGVVIESFNDKWAYTLIEIATAISNGFAPDNLTALTTSLVKLVTGIQMNAQ